jgi:hypothetical protein
LDREGEIHLETFACG